MCGVPFHAVDGYIARLVKKGFRVAICDQVEDPRKAKGVVKREVVRVVSPGTLTDANYLDAREPAFLMAVAPLGERANGRPTLGVALLDLSTGEFTAAEYHGADGTAGARRRARGAQAARDPRAGGVPTATSVQPRGRRSRRRSADDAGRRLGVRARSGAPHAARSAARRRPRRVRPRRQPAAVSRRRRARPLPARDAESRSRARARRSAYRQRADALLIDPTTLKHLEILEGSEGGRDGSLLDELDRTMTSIGSRLLRSWLLRPLLSLDRIRDRLDAVEELAFRTTERGKFRDAIKTVQDLERLVARAALGTAGPRDLVGLKQSLAVDPAGQDRARRPAGAAGPLAARRARRPGRRARPDRAHARRRSAGARARRRVHARRRRSGARRAARHQPLRQAGHRRDGGARARRAPASAR